MPTYQCATATTTQRGLPCFVLLFFFLVLSGVSYNTVSLPGKESPNMINPTEFLQTSLIWQNLELSWSLFPPLGSAFIKTIIILAISSCPSTLISLA